MDYIFSGSYTDDNGIDGVRCFAVNADMSLTQLCTADAVSPTYVLYQDGLLYAIGRTPTGCCIHTFSFDGHALTQVGFVHGPDDTGLCHLSIVGDMLYAAAYQAGLLLCCPLDADRLPTEPQIITYIGSGPHPRQEQPHIHSAFPSPDNRFLLVCDLGSDRIRSYRIDNESSLHPHEAQPEITAPAGSGPRHLTYSGDGTRVYVITELSAQVLVYARDPETGILTELQVTDCVPQQRPDDTLSADIHLSADGQFLYASSRGIDLMAMYRVLPDGSLEPPTYQSSFVSGPRNFCLSPDGKYAAIAGQYSNNIVLCAIDAQTGALSEPIFDAPMPQATRAQWVSR